MSIFSDSMGYAYGVMQDMAGEDVIFQYDQTQIKIKAVPGLEGGTEDMTGGRTRVTNRTLNWLIDANELVIDSQPVKPKRGNLIIRADGRRYRIAAPQQGPPWVWQDGYESFLEIQTIEAKPGDSPECLS